jgi:hypothetical protein
VKPGTGTRDFLRARGISFAAYFRFHPILGFRTLQLDFSCPTLVQFVYDPSDELRTRVEEEMSRGSRRGGEAYTA